MCYTTIVAIEMRKIEKCPRCNEAGILTEKTTITRGRHYLKFYVSHSLGDTVSSQGKRTHKIRWCYLNKEQLESLGVTQPKALHKRVTQRRNASKTRPSLEESLGRDSNPRPPPYQGGAPPG